MNIAKQIVRFHSRRNCAPKFSLFHNTKLICNFSNGFAYYSSDSNPQQKENSSSIKNNSSPQQDENSFGLDKIFPNPEDQSRKIMEDKLKQMLDQEVKPDDSDKVFPKPFIRFYNVAAIIALIILGLGFWNARQAEARGEKPPNYDAKLRIYEKQIDKMTQKPNESLDKDLELNDIKKQIQEEMKKSKI